MLRSENAEEDADTGDLEPSLCSATGDDHSAAFSSQDLEADLPRLRLLSACTWLRRTKRLRDLKPANAAASVISEATAVFD